MDAQAGTGSRRLLPMRLRWTEINSKGGEKSSGVRVEEAWTLFVETRTSGNPEVWMVLRNCLSPDMDAATAQVMISASGLSMPQNSLTLVIDASGVYYRVPIACINEPESFEVNAVEEALKKREEMQPTEAKTLALKVRSTKGDHELKVANT